MMYRSGRPIVAGLLTLALLAVAGDGAGAPATAQTKSYMTGTQFLAASPDQKASYAAGLADSLTGLYQAQLVDGFRWFETCVAQKSPGDLVRDFSKFLTDNPPRREEFAANNFIWAMAAVCKYQLPKQPAGAR